MKHDLELSAAMERALIQGAKDGPNADPPVEERKVVRASVVSGLCPRKDFYWLTGAPEDALDAIGACAFQDGKDLEASILDHLLWALDDPHHQTQVPCDLGWTRGRADLVTYDPIREYDGTSYEPAVVWDAKSANPGSFAATVRKGDVSEHYQTQLSIYATALGAKECGIAYRLKGGTKRENEAVYAVFRFALRLDLVAKAEAQVKGAMAARDGLVPVPARAYKKSDWQCQYCQFRSHCWRMP